MTSFYASRLAAVAVVLLTFATAGCIHIGKGGIGLSVPVPASTIMESRTIDHSVPDRPGLLTQEEFDSIAPSIRTLRAEPAELTAFRGDTLRMPDLVRIQAFDSAGVALGEIPRYDWKYSGRGFFLLTDGRVHLRRKGTVRFTVRLPKRLWSVDESERPSAQVTLMVVDAIH